MFAARPEPSSTVVKRQTRPFFFEIVATSASGLLFIAAVDTAARFNISWAPGFIWFGLLLIFLPAVLGMLVLDLSRNQRLGLVVLVGTALYWVKVLHSPAYFTLHDELLHWKTADAILQSGRLFAENPLLPVSPLFPVLQLTTASLAQLLAIDIYSAGVLLLGLLRIMFMIAVYNLFEYASRSARTAGFAALIYMGSSNFIFFASQYAYESVALPMGILLICLIIRRGEFSGMKRVSLNFVAVLFILVVVAAHHATSYIVTLFFLSSPLIVLAQPLLERGIHWAEGQITSWGVYRRWLARLIPTADSMPVQQPPARQSYLWTGLLFAAAIAAWTVYVATPTLRYLGTVFDAVFNELIRILQGANRSRALFTSAAGNVQPIWERLTSIGAVLLAAVIFPYGLLEIWRKYRRQTVALILMVAAGGYFVTLGLRFTEAGWEISNRATDYLFLGVALLTSLGALSLFRNRKPRLWHSLVLAFGTTIIFIGGFQAGWASWARVPGPYLVAADPRSIEPEGIAAAEWAAQHLKPNSQVIADRINGLLFGAFGRQYVIRSGTDNIQTAPVLFSLSMGSYEYELLRTTHTDYVVTDYRLTEGLPQLGVYVEVGEPDSMAHTVPLSPLAFRKFELLPGAGRVYDSGNIVVYDVKGLRDAQAQP